MTIDEPSVIDGRYRLEAVIGRGGMADVYRATDQVLTRPVAIKLLRDVAGDPRDRERFAAEARTLAGLNHPNLVTVLDAGIAAERPYLVLELVDGSTLDQECRGRPQDSDRVAGVGSQLADALAYVHSQGVVHRDVKPANVLLGGDGRVRLADFGIARLLGDTVRHTQTGHTIGTAAYLSPEQVRGQQVTPAADVYALGLVVLETLTGERAYPGSSTEAALARLSQPPAIPEAVPGPWRDLLVSMTDLIPESRPTAAEVARRLHDLANGVGSPPAPAAADHTLVMSSPTEVMAPPAVSRVTARATAADTPGRSGYFVLPRHTRPALIALALLLLVGVIVVIVALQSGSGQAPSPGEIPAQTPRELRGPLQDLHDAIEGGP